MSASFGPGALRLAGLAAHMLGWRPAEFWSATPAELAACLAPAHPAASPGISRADLNRLMEHQQ